MCYTCQYKILYTTKKLIARRNRHFFGEIMGFVKVSGEFVRQRFIPIDDIFITEYMPDADPTDVKIYLYGLSCALKGEGELSYAAGKLQLTEERIRSGFKFWEKKGLVKLSAIEPFSVTYLSVREPEPTIVKLNAEKYKPFTEEAYRIYPERFLTPNVLNMYMELMESEKMEINAMLLIMQYCKDLGGGEKMGMKHVCDTARAWAKEGFLTEKKVAAHIADLENNNESIRKLFEALGIRRVADIDDRQMYHKWTKYGFTLDAMLVAARSRKKKGGMEKLDLYMEELKKAGAITAADVASYTENKEKIRDLAVEICKILGIYYSNAESVVEVYVMPWLSKGFERDALLRLARYCFLRNVHTLDVMQSMVDKVAALGLFTENDIDTYVDRQIKIDEKIRAVYDACGYAGAVTNRDRENYKNWVEWGFDDETILAVAGRHGGAAFPLQLINRTLGSMRVNKVFGKEDVLASMDKQTDKKPSQADDYMQHHFSEEKLKSALVNFDDWGDE